MSKTKIILKKAIMGRRQADIDRIAELEQQVNDREHTIHEVGMYLGIRTINKHLPTELQFREKIGDMVLAKESDDKELAALRFFMKKVKAWVKELPIEARVDMPELQS